VFIITNDDRIRKYKDLPDIGEYIIATIREINPSSAIATLDEYEDKKAIIHISEISSSWVKDIRKFIKEGQKVVAVVLNLDKRGYIELSMKRVKPTIAREKIKEYRNEKKAHNFLKMIAKDLNMSLDEIYEKAGFIMQKEFGSMYSGFEIALEEGIEALTSLNIDKRIAEKIYSFAVEYIKPKELVIKGDINLIVYEDNGIEIIKKALDFKDKIRITYLSSPRYRLELIGEDYKKMEQKLKNVLEEIENRLKGYNYLLSFERIKN